MSTIYLFPGQGSQHVGMGQALYEQESAARAVFDQADEHLGFSISKLCFEGPEEELTDTVNQQPALFVTSLAAWAVMQEQGNGDAAFFAGHSLGEFSALVAADAISFEEGLTLVRRRGELMKSAGETAPGAMSAILGLEMEQVREICTQAQVFTGKPVQVANDNCPGQVVISGDENSLESAERMAKEAGARKVTRLPITIAAHSPLMTTAAMFFTRAVHGAPIRPAGTPIIANTTAQPITSIEDIRRELIAQLTGSVLWAASMRYALEHGVQRFVEVGPGDVLTSLMKRINRNAERKAFMADRD
ncbi:MAG: ACP S-malonyltransferase [Chloroflexota bacterium]